VIQGANDPRVKKQESDQIVVAAREKGLDVAYLVAPNEGHGFSQLDNRLVVAAAIEKFFAKHLGGRYQEEVEEDIAQRWQELKVEVDSVTMPDTSFLKGEAKADFPTIDGSNLKPSTSNYKQLVESRGQQVEMEMTREIQKAQIDGQDAILIINKSESPRGISKDSTYLNHKDGAPIKRIIDQGRAKIILNYTEDKVTGTMEMGPQSRAIEIDLDKKVLVAPDILTRTMPLATDYTAQFGAVDVMQQQVKDYLLEVIGQEEVQVPAGNFDSYKIEIKPVDGSAGKQTLYVTTDKPHIIVKSIEEIPPMMGGGTVTTELKGQ